MIHQKLEETIKAFNINFDADSADPLTEEFFSFAQLLVNLWGVYALKGTPHMEEALKVAKESQGNLISIGVLKINGEEVKTTKELPQNFHVVMNIIEEKPSIEAIINGFNTLNHPKNAMLDGTKVVFEEKK